MVIINRARSNIRIGSPSRGCRDSDTASAPQATQTRQPRIWSSASWKAGSRRSRAQVLASPTPEEATSSVTCGKIPSVDGNGSRLPHGRAGEYTPTQIWAPRRPRPIGTCCRNHRGLRRRPVSGDCRQSGAGAYGLAIYAHRAGSWPIARECSNVIRRKRQGVTNLSVQRPDVSKALPKYVHRNSDASDRHGWRTVIDLSEQARPQTILVQMLDDEAASRDVGSVVVSLIGRQ